MNERDLDQQNAKSQGRNSHSKNQNRQAKHLHKKKQRLRIIDPDFVREQLNAFFK